MPIPISAKVQQLRPSPSMAAKQRVLELEAAGRTILDFCLGEPDFDTPAFIIDAAEQAMRAGDTHYTAAQGKLSLREAVSRKLATENGVGRIVLPVDHRVPPDDHRQHGQRRC